MIITIIHISKSTLMKTKFFLLLIVSSFLFGSLSAQENDVMYVHYINVGQANAALLEFPCGAVLIDAGAQDKATTQHLIDYLDDFFARRKDLHRTLDLVYVTHCHLDHNAALAAVADSFKIVRYIDNGQQTGSGKTNQLKLEREAAARGIQYATYPYETITNGGNKKGLTNMIIDPIKCETIDPKIILYSGAFTTKPATGWTKDDFENNGNNHSLFIKVLFGKASFLFIGDGEIAEMNTVTNYYNGTDALDVDVLMVGHHGAKNATTHNFLDAVTPNYAVISCGQWDDSTSGGKFNTYNYGHPTDSALNMLAAHVPYKRSHPITVKAGLKAKTFIDVTVSKRIYATPWDGDIVIRATSDGKYRTQLSSN